MEDPWPTSPKRNYRRRRVSDTGTGIPIHVQDRIFDPFFTTKDVGQGTGQGLTMCYATIVKKYGGSLSFVTDEGRGTTFLIRLPLEGDRKTIAPDDS